MAQLHGPLRNCLVSIINGPAPFNLNDSPFERLLPRNLVLPRAVICHSDIVNYRCEELMKFEFAVWWFSTLHRMSTMGRASAHHFAVAKLTWTQGNTMGLRCRLR